MGILLSFLNLCLYIALICLIAYVIVWVITGIFNWAIPPNVYKFGQIFVALLCLIAVVAWLNGLLGGGTGLPHFFPIR